MKARSTLVLLVLMAAVPFAAIAQSFDLDALLALSTREGPALREAGIRLERALARAAMLEAELRTRVALRSTGVRVRKGLEDREQSVGTTVTATRPLLSSGELSFSAGNRLGFATNDEVDLMITQNPSARAAWSQPVFVGGAFIDMEPGRARVREPELVRKDAANSLRADRWNIALDLSTLYTILVETELQRGVLEARTELSRLVANRLRETESGSRFGGLEARERQLDVLLLEAEVSRAEQQSRTLRQEMAILTGVEPSAIRTSPTLPAAAGLAAVGPTAPEGSEEAPSVASALVELSRSRAAEAQGRLLEAPVLNTALIFSTDYKNDNIVERDFQESFTDFLEEGASIDLELRVEMDIPLYVAGRRKQRLAELEAARKAASLSVERARNTLAVELQELEAERRYHARRLEVESAREELLQRQLDAIERLTEAGQRTPEELAQARVEAAEVRLQLWRARASLFLATLETQALLGADPAALFQTE